MKNKKLIIALSCVLALIISLSSIFLFSFDTVADDTTRIAIDCAVSFELSLTSTSKVESVTAVNSDAEEILQEHEILNLDLVDAAKIIFEAVSDEGYITKSKNSILFSAQKTSSAEVFLSDLSTVAQNIFTQNEINPCILTQSFHITDTITDISEKYQISFGKARFIKQIIEQDMRYSIDELANLSINELNIITQSGNLKLVDVYMVGFCNNSGYITYNDAVEEALSNAKLWETDVDGLKCTLDVIDNRPVYRVLFAYKGMLYEYEIDSKSGTLLYFDKNDSTELLDEVLAIQSYSFYNDPDVAKYYLLLIASNHAGIEVAHVTNFFETDEVTENGSYKALSFNCDGYTYTYKINTATNEISDYSKKKIYAEPDAEEYTITKNENDYIGVDNATVVAFNHAGITGNDVINYIATITKNREEIFYDISFQAGGYNYSYMINAKSAVIIKYEKYKSN